PQRPSILPGPNECWSKKICNRVKISWGAAGSARGTEGSSEVFASAGLGVDGAIGLLGKFRSGFGVGVLFPVGFSALLSSTMNGVNEAEGDADGSGSAPCEKATELIPKVLATSNERITISNVRPHVG